MTEKFDIIIAGAGMVGLGLATSLARAGLKVCVLEKTSMPAQLEPEFDGRVCAISLGSQRILEDIGAWENMKDYAEPILDIRVTDGETPFFLHFDHTEVGDEPVGFIIENRYIRHGLQQTAATLPNLKIIDNFAIKSIETTPCKISINRLACNLGFATNEEDLSDEAIQNNNKGWIASASPRNDESTREYNEEITAKLLIGADGRGSQIRELTGIGKTTWGYKQTAIVCTIEHELPHCGLAQERFLPAGPFAVLPMQGNKSSLVWVEPDERVGVYMELEEPEFLQEISQRVGKYLGKITGASSRFSYPLSLLHAKQYVGERVALIGDAAHGMHPIAGQGVNLGFRDVPVLAELIKRQAALGLDIGGVALTQEYAKLRRFDTITMLGTMDLLNRLFSNNLLPIRAARDIGLWAVGKMPPLKRFFMRQAMGI